MRKKGLSVTLTFLPLVLLCQMGFEDIRGKVIALQSSSVNEKYIEEQIELKSNLYFSDEAKKGIVDTGVVAYGLAYLFMKVEKYDSAFHYIYINSKLKGWCGIMGLDYTINLLNDYRFNTILDSCINNQTGINNLGVRNVKNTPLVKEWRRINLLGFCVKNLYNLMYNDPIHAKEVRELQEQFRKYELRRSKEIIEEFGLPTYSEHGYEVTSKIYGLLWNWSKDVLLEHIEGLEELALKNELNGQFIAHLVDQKLVLNGNKQKYGTISIHLNGYNRNIPYPISDIENVNERRKNIGLEYTLEQQYEMISGGFRGF